jgi:hypothetical protein
MSFFTVLGMLTVTVLGGWALVSVLVKVFDFIEEVRKWKGYRDLAESRAAWLNQAENDIRRLMAELELLKAGKDGPYR